MCCDGFTLHLVLAQTSNVNQGDSLEHDFSSMYSLVMFPLQFVLKSDCRCDDFIDQGNNIKTVKLVYRIFMQSGKAWKRMFLVC